MHAEVINLSRNVVITGDDFKNVQCDPAVQNPVLGCKCDSARKRTQCTMGLHTGMLGELGAPGGQIQFKHVRVEKCGQRGVTGKYCMHMHYLQSCPTCKFLVNAVEGSMQRGLVIHGTHMSTAEHNVFSNVRGANMYIEDGGEMFNVLAYNVAICPWELGKRASTGKQGCTVPGTDNDQADTEVQSFCSSKPVSIFFCCHFVSCAFLNFPLFLPFRVCVCAGQPSWSLGPVNDKPFDW
jgi:hypothetical protein